MERPTLKRLLKERRRTAARGWRRFGIFVLFAAVVAALWFGWSQKALSMAVQSLRAGRPSEALTRFQDQLPFKIHRAEIYDGMGVCHVLLRRFDEAENDFRKSLAVAGGPKTLCDPVRDVLAPLTARGDYQSLISYTDYLKTWWPDSRAIAFYRAYALNAREELDQAEALFIQTRADPRFRKASARHLRYIAIKRKQDAAVHLFDRNGAPLAGYRLKSGRVFYTAESLALLIGDKGKRGTLLDILPRFDLYNKVTLTLDYEIQEAAQRLLGDYDGAFIAIDPSSGAVLAAVSHPVNSKVFMNRAFYDTFPPGDLAQLVTASAVLQRGMDEKKFFPYLCKGKLHFPDGGLLRDLKAHGKILSLEDAMAISCDSAFAELGARAGETSLRVAWKSLGLGHTLKVRPLNRASLGRVEGDELFSPYELARFSVGRGHVNVSPLAAVLLACAVAERGAVMRPHLVERKSNLLDTVYARFTPSVMRELWRGGKTAQVSERLKNAMTAAVRLPRGTAHGVAPKGLSVAAKTGDSTRSLRGVHWLVAFAPVENPRIAFAAAVEPKAGLPPYPMISSTREFLDFLVKKGYFKPSPP